MRIDVLTLFPDIFDGPLGQSILGRAVEQGLIDVNLVNIREFADGPHSVTDEPPFGGGAGEPSGKQWLPQCLDALLESDLGAFPPCRGLRLVVLAGRIHQCQRSDPIGVFEGKGLGDLATQRHAAKVHFADLERVT